MEPITMLALAGGATGALGSYLGGEAQKKAADKAAEMELWKLSQAMPLIKAGKAAVPQYAELATQGPMSRADFYDQYPSDPGFQFELSQGRQAVEGGAAARGNLLSGRTLQALQDYGQNLARTRAGQAYTQELQGYNARLNPLQNLVAGSMNALGMAAPTGQTQLAYGDAAAGQIGGITEAIGGTFTDMGGLFMGSGGGGGGLSSLFAGSPGGASVAPSGSVAGTNYGGAAAALGF